MKLWHFSWRNLKTYRKPELSITDNSSNIKKAVKDIGLISLNIRWQPCIAYIFQLVVRKDLNLVKLLVLRVKRLIDFFLRPK